MSTLLRPTAAGLTLLLGACDALSSPPEPPKHVVLVVVDTLRADALLDPGNLVDTPIIDRFANEGVAFEEALAHAPMTLPSHTAMFASRPPHRTGVLNNGQPVPSDLPLLPEHLTSLGFQTFGVFSLGTLARYHGVNSTLDRGFGAYFGASQYVADAEQALAVVRENFAPHPELRSFVFFHVADPHEPYNDRGAEPKTALVTLDDVSLCDPVNTTWMSEFSEFVAAEPGEHVIEFTADHELLIRSLQVFADGEAVDLPDLWREPGETIRVPFQVPAGAREVEVKFWLTDAPPGEDAPRRYLTEVEYVDRYFGEVTELLRERGILDDCLLVFTSDHGEAFGEHGYWAHVQSLHEEMIHVPLFFWASEDNRGILRSLAKGDGPASHADVVPTILDLLDLPPLPGQEGRSLAGSPGPFLHLAETHPPEAERDVLCLRDDDRKLVYYAGEDRFELFDLVADPLESTDVFAARGSEVVGWQKDLRARAGEAFELQRVAGELSEESMERLKALGYFGD